MVLMPKPFCRRMRQIRAPQGLQDDLYSDPTMLNNVLKHRWVVLIQHFPTHINVELIGPNGLPPKLKRFLKARGFVTRPKRTKWLK